MRGLLQLTHGKLLTIIYCNLLDAKKGGRKGKAAGKGAGRGASKEWRKVE